MGVEGSLDLGLSESKSWKLMKMGANKTSLAATLPSDEGRLASEAEGILARVGIYGQGLTDGELGMMVK